jgi:probable phosphoglycerate mutase
MGATHDTASRLGWNRATDMQSKRASMAEPSQQVFVVRHGETEWSLSGQHTGTTDIPLTEHGRQVARLLQPILAKESFALVLTSPLQRARETSRLAGFGDVAKVEPDLVEWNYGHYEGLTTSQILAAAPDWQLFRDGCPDGEKPGEIGARADRVIAEMRAVEGNVLLFAHGHVLRVLASRWLGLPPSAGRHFLLDTATMNILGYYRGVPAIRRWNAPVQA